MSTLLKIQSSLFNGQGQSSALADRFAARWLAQHPGGRIISRDLAAEPVPHLTSVGLQAFASAPAERTEEQDRIVAYSDALIEELRSADVIVFGIPMYNFTVPSVLHAYFDHITRAGVTFRYTADGPEGFITGKKAYAFITRGGVHGEDHAQTRFLRQILGFVGITDVEFTYAEGLALDDDSKAASLTAAEERIAQLVSATANRPTPLAQRQSSM